MDAMRRVVMAACAALLLVTLILKSRPGGDTQPRAVFRVVSGDGITVSVTGDVSHSGVYKVPANYLATSVIEMAGPLRPLNRSKTDAAAAEQSLHNGSVVRLELQADGTHRLSVADMTVPERIVLGIPLEIAAMNEADFDRLPGIGPALARRIVEFRHKNDGILRVEDLASVEGIGEKKYRVMQKFFQRAEIKY